MRCVALGVTATAHVKLHTALTPSSVTDHKSGKNSHTADSRQSAWLSNEAENRHISTYCSINDHITFLLAPRSTHLCSVLLCCIPKTQGFFSLYFFGF